MLSAPMCILFCLLISMAVVKPLLCATGAGTFLAGKDEAPMGCSLLRLAPFQTPSVEGCGTERHRLPFRARALL